jgi:signal peptidase I
MEDPIQEDHQPILGNSLPQSEQSKKPFTQTKIFAVLNYVFNLFIILLIVLFIRAYIIAPFQVSGASMTDTLDDKEYIIVNKLLYHGFLGFNFGAPQRGDIVVIEPPINKQIYYIKRIIGLPGETLRFDGNRVIITNNEHPEGFTLDESYLKCMETIGGTAVNTCLYDNVTQKEFQIPEGSYFVMGDNRNNSTDSRACFLNCTVPGSSNFVRLEHIVGKTWFVVWPITHLRFMSDINYQM